MRQRAAPRVLVRLQAAGPGGACEVQVLDAAQRSIKSGGRAVKLE